MFFHSFRFPSIHWFFRLLLHNNHCFVPSFLLVYIWIESFSFHSHAHGWTSEHTLTGCRWSVLLRVAMCLSLNFFPLCLLTPTPSRLHRFCPSDSRCSNYNTAAKKRSSIVIITKLWILKCDFIRTQFQLFWKHHKTTYSAETEINKG